MSLFSLSVMQDIAFHLFHDSLQIAIVYAVS